MENIDSEKDSEKIRDIVVPGELLSEDKHKRGGGVYREAGKIYSLFLGVKSIKENVISVIPLNGKYIPKVGDLVIGTVSEVSQSNWMVNIGSFHPAFLHINDVPWRVGNDLEKYLDIEDTIIATVSDLDEVMHITISMREATNIRKIETGVVMKITPAKVPRVIGKKGSMISMIKDYTKTRIIVGMNGVIWIDGQKEAIDTAVKVIETISEGAQMTGLTDFIKKMLINWSNKKNNGVNGDVNE